MLNLIDNILSYKIHPCGLFINPWTISFPHMFIFIQNVHFYPYVISFMLATSIHMMNSIYVHNSTINIVSFMSYNACSSYQFHPFGHDHFHPFGQIYLWKKTKVSLGGTTRNVTISFYWTHWTFQKIKNHSNKYFHLIFLCSTFTSCMEFETLMI